MTAVFAKNERDFQELQLRPNKNFKRIHRLNDVLGHRFEGVIFIPGWYDSLPLIEAYEHLIIRQPELKL